MKLSSRKGIRKPKRYSPLPIPSCSPAQKSFLIGDQESRAQDDLEERVGMTPPAVTIF
jgi:hypothetical protein